jgi:uncharacterized protein (DUF1800 family)
MKTPPDLIREPDRAWQPFEPGRDGTWNAARVAHLHRRAGFGATLGQLRRDLADGYEATLRRVLNGDERGPDGRSPAEFAEVVEAMEDSARRRPSVDRVRMLWLFQAIYTSFPLAEVMTLAWHGHYATGASKVRRSELLLAQGRTLRNHWRAPVSRLHLAILRDPAMLRWLDGFDSHKAHPNENLGREFLELFALGEGRYTERDVREVARALTGWIEKEGDEAASLIDPSAHDAAEKTILGETGPWTDEDVVRIVCKQPAAATHIARRLFRTFVCDVEPVDDALLAPLADAMRTRGDVDVARGIETVLRSRLFHSDWCRGRRVKSPVEFAVGAIRSLEAVSPPPDFVDLEIWLTRMGQRLFDPPSVSGWPGGLAWLRGPSLVARANFAAWLTEPSAPLGPEKADALAARQGLQSPERWLDSLAVLLIPAPFAPDVKAKLVASARGTSGRTDHAAILRQFLALPECQLA